MFERWILSANPSKPLCIPGTRLDVEWQDKPQCFRFHVLVVEVAGFTRLPGRLCRVCGGGDTIPPEGHCDDSHVRRALFCVCASATQIQLHT